MPADHESVELPMSARYDGRLVVRLSVNLALARVKVDLEWRPSHPLSLVSTSVSIGRLPCEPGRDWSDSFRSSSDQRIGGFW
jgi:hypothetical protein